jgi:CDP-diacylglycerol---glycerol-3-phosphate 3-phosphatidyltransferase
MNLADQLTLVRVLAVPVVLFLADFHAHDYWATAVFIVAMTTDCSRARRAAARADVGARLAARPGGGQAARPVDVGHARRRGRLPAWMVAAIVAREFLVSGLRLAALERGVVMRARDLGKLKTWSQATAAAVGGFAAAGAWSKDVAWWAILIAVALTWLSGLDYARLAPGLLSGRTASP